MVGDTRCDLWRGRHGTTRVARAMRCKCVLYPHPINFLTHLLHSLLETLCCNASLKWYINWK